MFNKIKKFLKYLRTDISKSFLYSQAPFDQILIDKVYSFFKCKTKKFNIIENKVNARIFNNEKEKLLMLFEKSKSVRVENFSSGLEVDFVPEIFKTIIQNHRSEINNYLGNNILIESPLFFRNYNFDKKFSGFDVYSNVWHQDSHDGNKLLKIFILMEDVGKDDGPLMWLDEHNTRLNWEEISDRWNFNAFKKVKSFKNQRVFLGEAGTYSIVDTSRCMHRAGIPAVKRDMMALTIYPNWRRTINRKELKL